MNAHSLESEVRLAGSFGGGVPPMIVAGALRAIVPAARSSTFMAIEGRGRLTGRPPKWAADVADIRFRGATAHHNEMILRFLAPSLGQAAPHLYRQHDFWRLPPDESVTAFDLLFDTLEDVSIENRDSDFFDQDVLRDIARFDKIFAGEDVRIRFKSLHYPNRKPIEITKATIENVKSLRRTTPTSHQVRVVGILDMIRASTQGFALKLDDGSEISGIYEKGEISDLQPLFRQRVVIGGMLIYRPSGKPLRVDATYVRLAGEESSLWSRLPSAPHERLKVHKLAQPQTTKTGLSAVIGRWPSDELEEEVARRLVDLS
jgi:hypothetical protein